jgi:hypothetical protein
LFQHPEAAKALHLRSSIATTVFASYYSLPSGPCYDFVPGLVLQSLYRMSTGEKITFLLTPE